MADRLRQATTEGRLTVAELEERLERLYGSRTYGELDALLADLPVHRSSGRPTVRVPRWAAAAAVLTVLAGVLSMLAVPRRHYFPADAGGGHFRHFGFPGPLADPHHGMIVTAPGLGVFAALVICMICVALVWVLLRSRANSDGR